MAKPVDSARDERDGSNELNGDQLRAFMRMHAEAEERCRIANESRKKLRKEMKAAGINLGDFDAINRMTDWGRDEVNETFDRRRQYAVWLKLPIGTQGGLFDGSEDDAPEVSQETQEDAAFAKGYQAGVKGLARDVPEGFREFDQKWLEGYTAGQKSIAMDMIDKRSAH